MRGADHQPWKDLYEDVRKALGSPTDLVLRRVTLRGGQTIQCFYLESMVDKQTIGEYVLRKIDDEHGVAEKDAFVREIPFSVPHDDMVNQTVTAIIHGQCVVVDHLRERVCLVDVFEPASRPVEEPKAEAIIRGPHEGFTENILANVGLIRKRIRNPNLRFEKMTIGKQSHTTVLLAYMENLAPELLVQEARRRLTAIRTDSILDSTYVEEFIQDKTLTPFPTLGNTERPDVVSAQLLDGKVAILVDGTPSALVAPVTFFEFFTSPEDYYQRADIATFIRWIRMISFVLAVFVPSIYVAATTFHQELIPTQLLISLSAQREGVPLPSLVEVLVMEVLFEIIREAGLRMPRAVGQALSIVGAIVLGQAAVEAGLTSAAIVIVVSITGIANFVVPTYSFGITQRLLRFTFVFLAGFMGLFGILCGLLFMVAHLVSLKTFGVPYLTPVVPLRLSEWKDVLIRVPRPAMKIGRLPSYIEYLKKRK
jgi:spore germination protein KA